MKAWKRCMSRIMSVIMLAGTLANSGFTVTAADDEGPLTLKEGEEWVAGDEADDPEPAGENAGDGKESVSEDAAAEEAVSTGEADKDAETDDAAPEEAVSGNTISEDEAEEEETDLTDPEESEIKWYYRAIREWDPHMQLERIRDYEIWAEYNGEKYFAEINKGEMTSGKWCLCGERYDVTATVKIGEKEYSTVRNLEYDGGYGHNVDNVTWSFSDLDLRNPYPVALEGTCPECGAVFKARVEWRNRDAWEADCVEPRVIGFDLNYKIEEQEYTGTQPLPDTDLVDENGNPEWDGKGLCLPLFPCGAEIEVPPTGIHSFMCNNELPWWDWQYIEEEEKWTVTAIFSCGGHEIYYGEDSPEVTLTCETKDDITSYTATFKSDNFYNKETGKLDRSVTYTANKQITANCFEISGIKDMLYTGKALQQEELWIRYKNRDLQEGVDYTLKYSNNKNAGEATLTITGKGKFSGKVAVRFNILPVDINTDNFSINDQYLIENGKAQKKASVLYWNGVEVAKKNYETVFETGADAYKNTGMYTVTVKGKGKNFTGERKYRIYIMPVGEGEEKIIPVSKVKVEINNDYIKLDPWGIDWDLFNKRDKDGRILAYKVTYGKEDVTEAFEECYFECDQNTGKGVMIFVANSMRWIEISDKSGKKVPVHFGGSFTKKVTAGMTDISKLDITIPASIDYRGYAISIWELRDFYGFAITDKNVTVDDGMGNQVPFVLNLGENFDVTLKKNNKPGKMSVIISGKKGYSGKVTKVVEIIKPDLSVLKKNGELLVGRWVHDDEKDEDYFVMPEVAAFSKGGSVIGGLEVGRKMANTWIDEEGIEHRDEWDSWFEVNKDYTVKYSTAGVPEAGKSIKATLTISGKGSYTGSVEYSFEIEERNIGETKTDVQAVAIGKKVSATMKPYLAKVDITDWDSGKKLVQGKDYTLKYYRPVNDDEGNLLDEDKWTEFDAGTKWQDVFGPGEENLIKDGQDLVVKVSAVKGSGYTGETYHWYSLVKSQIKPGEFKLKDQTIALNEWGDPEPWKYFMPDKETDNLYDYLMNCSDQEYKAWADKYFAKYPTDCRFAPALDSIENADKPGKKASVTIWVMINGEWECNTGCRGGFVNVKFKVVNKGMIKD